MNILIAGSSGLIGRALVKSLKENGHLVVRLIRPDSPIPESDNPIPESDNPIPEQGGHITEPDSPIPEQGGHIIWSPETGQVESGQVEVGEKAGKEVDTGKEDSDTVADFKIADFEIADFDVVINLCGEPVAKKRWNNRQKKRIYSSRVNTTSLLASLMTDSNPNNPLFKTRPKMLINASAIGIYGDTGNQIVTDLQNADSLNNKTHKNIRSQNTSSENGNFLAGVCRDWEAAAQPAAEAGIQTFFLRIGLVVSENARFLKLQKPLFKLGLGGWMGSPKNSLSWISLKDVVGSILFILENPSAFENQTTDAPAPADAPAANMETPNMTALNLTAPESATAKEFAKALGEAMRRPVFFRIPKFGPQILMGRELVNTLLQSARVVPERLLSAGYKFNHTNIKDAFKEVI